MPSSNLIHFRIYEVSRRCWAGQGASQIHLVLQYSRSSKYSGAIVKDQAISVDDIVYDDQKLKEKATELVRGFWGSK